MTLVHRNIHLSQIASFEPQSSRIPSETNLAGLQQPQRDEIDVPIFAQLNSPFQISLDDKCVAVPSP